MGRGSLGFSPELRTPPLPATHVRAGTGHGHWPGTTPSTSIEPPIGAFTHLVRPRVAPSRRSRSARRAVPPGYLTLTRRRLPYRLLTHHISLIDTCLNSAVSSYRGLERSSPTISTCFTYPQPISRSAVRHTPCTVGGSSGRPDRPGGM